MKNIWLITKTNIKKHAISLLLSLSGAIILCFLVNAFRNMIANDEVSKIKIGFLDLDQSELSETFKGYLSEDLDYLLLQDLTFEELSTELIDKHISAIIEIPEKFQEKVTLRQKPKITMTSLEDFENAAFLEAYLNSFLGSIDMLSTSANGDKETFERLFLEFKQDTIVMNQSEAAPFDMKMYVDREGFNNTIGFFLMIIFGLGLVVAYMIVDDRNTGVLHRIKITTVKPAQYILGIGIFGMILSLIQVGVFCGFLAIMDIQIGFPIWLLVLAMTLFSLFTVCFCMTSALALKSKNAILSIAISFSTAANLLGGAYFPIDLAPKSLQSLARVTPQFWFMEIFRTLQKNPDANIAPNIIILVLFTLLIFLIGAVLYNQYQSNN